MNRKRLIDKARLYVARKCGGGDTCACAKGKRIFAAASLSIMAGSLADLKFEDDGGHPNQLPFKGVLLILDQASTKPPHGSRGHRIYVPSDVAKENLEGLRGMAINYDPEDLDSHQTRNKIGIITDCGIDGNKVWVKGIIWKKDFPEAATKLTGRRDLGMSMELANVYVRDEDEAVWHLEKFDFTGATILKKSAAAYYSTELAATSDRKKTALAASAAAASGKNCKGEVMKTKKASTSVAAASNSGSNAALLVGALKGAFTDAIGPLVAEMRASNDRQRELGDSLEELKGLHLIQASAHEEEEEDDVELEAAAHEEEDDEDDDMAAAKKDKSDSEDENEDDNDDDDGEEDDLSAELEDLEIEDVEKEPGEVNKDAKNKGDKNTVTDPPTQKEKVAGNIAKKRLHSAASKRIFPKLKSSASIQAAAVMVDTMRAQMDGLKRKNRKMQHEMQAAALQTKKLVKGLKTQIDTLKAQVERHAETVDRRSSALPIEIRNLLAKANVDPREIQAGSAEKLTVDAVDSVFSVLASEGVVLEPVKKAEYKNRMVQLGLMESGEERYAA